MYQRLFFIDNVKRKFLQRSYIVIQEELRNRLKSYKEDTGISYKKICDQCEIPTSAMYAFNGGYRKLQEGYAEALE